MRVVFGILVLTAVLFSFFFFVFDRNDHEPKPEEPNGMRLIHQGGSDPWIWYDPVRRVTCYEHQYHLSCVAVSDQDGGRE